MAFIFMILFFSEASAQVDMNEWGRASLGGNWDNPQNRGAASQHPWSRWGIGRKTYFHASVLSASGEEGRRTRYAEEVTVRASADPTPPPSRTGDVCHYAGYLSVVQENGTCLYPWSLGRWSKRQAREQLGILYTKYEACGRRNQVRCNPALYGTASVHRGNRACRSRGGQDKGCCVRTVNENDPGEVNTACNLALFGGNPKGDGSVPADPERMRRFLASLEGDHAKQASYLNTAMAVLDSSCASPDRHRECTLMREVLGESVDFFRRQDSSGQCLGRGLLALETDLDSLTDRIGLHFYDTFLLNAVSHAFSWKERKKHLLPTIIGRYENDPRTKTAMEAARRNAREFPNRNQCYRYVKHALNGKDCSSRPRERRGFCRGRKIGESYYTDDEYPWGNRYAKNAEPEVAEHGGFVDITDSAYGFEGGPEEAPVGSVIVYRPRPNRGAGHIEIVTVDEQGKRWYCANTCQETPVSSRKRLGQARVPTAIMIHMEESEKRLFEQ